MLNVLFSTAFTTIFNCLKSSDSDFNHVKLDYSLSILACMADKIKKILQMRPQNLGPVSQQIWHDKDPSSLPEGNKRGTKANIMQTSAANGDVFIFDPIFAPTGHSEIV